VLCQAEQVQAASIEARDLQEQLASTKKLVGTDMAPVTWFAVVASGLLYDAVDGLLPPIATRLFAFLYSQAASLDVNANTCVMTVAELS
jgi:hypothetical protein